jgi:magnesium-transporting ATPase (P-type)
VVVYAGADTKIMKNLKTTGIKASVNDKKLQYLVAFTFAFNIIVLIISVVSGIFWQVSKSTRNLLQECTNVWHIILSLYSWGK